MPRAHKSQPQTSIASPLQDTLSFYGVDVSKAELVIAGNGQLITLANQQPALMDWLSQLPDGTLIAMEATNSYHQLLAELAVGAGHRVFVVNPKQIKHYRPATGIRAKTDLCDAQLIARFLEKEHTELTPYQPLTPAQRRLSLLLRRRATIVKSSTQLRLSMEPVAQELEVQAYLQASLASLKELIGAIDAQIKQLLQHADRQSAAVRLQTIVGVGPLNAAALLVALEHGHFVNADAFVASLGLDPKPWDSGQKIGRRRLSKQGDSETRRLLFNAARSASITKTWQPIYERYRKRGFSDVQTLCIIARKIARTAWSIYKHGTTFSPERLTQALT